MISLSGLKAWILTVLADFGHTQDALEREVQAFLDAAGGDVKIAGETWMKQWVPVLNEKLGDFDSAKLMAAQIWESATGHTPKYAPDHFFSS